MTPKQAADYLQVEVKTIRNWTSKGKVPVFKIGCIARDSKAALDEKMAPAKSQ
ncbi:helix-turn-helix domain-containing protein [Candidatus Neomarinimicrobiota bacterium]